MLKRSLFPALLLAATAAFCQAPDPAADSIRIVSTKRTADAATIEWVHTLDCRAGGVSPSLRVTLAHTSSTASAGVALAVGADDRATGTVTVRVQIKDREAGDVRRDC
jgi:hypothetical protein